jgi:hypothetical protein
MSKGFLIFAEDVKLKKYTRSAYALALSIKNHMPNADISLVTDNKIPEKYRLVFDQIVPVPWRDQNKSNTFFKTEDRWKLYHCSPYDETIVLDADMLAFSNLDLWWDYAKNYDVLMTSNVLDYRGKVITGRYYRKTFDSNNLPNLYFGAAYFKKSDYAKEYFNWVEDITNNWELFYGRYVNVNYPKLPSMDVSVSLAAKILDCENFISHKNAPITFTHMKPMIQNWESPTESWQDSIGAYFNKKCELKIGNYQQHGLFHYTEYSFLTDYILNQLEKITGIN